MQIIVWRCYLNAKYLAGKSGQNWAYHGMTISNPMVLFLAALQESLHQFASLFNQEFEDDVSSDEEFTGRGQSTLNMDNYQLL